MIFQLNKLRNREILFLSPLFSLALGLLTAQLTWASDLHSPRTAALGGSGHAGPLLNDSIILNPSFASFLPTYSIGLTYLTYSETPLGANAGSLNGRNFSGSIQDGRSELFQAGLSYTRKSNGAFVHVGASKAVVKRLGFGLGGKFYFDGGGRAPGHDMTFSISGIATEWFQAAFIVDNLLQTDAGRAWGLYREYILGLKFNVKGIVLVYLDPHLIPDLPGQPSFGYESGLEFVLMSDLFLRLGIFRNSMVPMLGAHGRGFGAGIGWMAPRLSLDYGLARAIEPHGATAHTFGATVYF